MYEVWKTANLNNASQLITTVNHDIEKMPADIGQIDAIDIVERGTVVDFGCGVGRNTFYLAEVCGTVLGFDFPNMLEMLRNRPAWKTHSNIKLFSVWSELAQLDFDTVYCCISLQHLCTKDIQYYIGEFAKKAKNLYVHGRDFNDHDGDNVWKIIAESNLWQIDSTFGAKDTLEGLFNAVRYTHSFTKWMIK